MLHANQQKYFVESHSIFKFESFLKFKTMGFGGAAATNAVIKNNRELLKNRELFKRTPGKFNISEGKYNYPEASSKQLRNIRKHLNTENRHSQFRIYTILISIMICIITILIFFG